jgi:hypothetical protein
MVRARGPSRTAVRAWSANMAPRGQSLAIVTIACLLATPLVSGSIDPMPTANVRAFIPLSRGTSAALGNLRLSQSLASFSKLNGRMDLELVGLMPDFGDREISGAKIFRVVNSDAFHSANNNSDAPCGVRTITFLGVRLLGDFTPRSGEPDVAIRVSLFSIPDYREVGPNWVGLCRADTYALQ